MNVRRRIKKDLNSAKTENRWADIALFILYPYSFLTGLVRMQGIHIIYPAFLLSIIVLVFVGKTCFDKRLYKKYLTLILFVFVFMLLNMVFVGNTNIKYIIYGVFIFPALSALLFFYKVKFWNSVLLFGGVSAVFLLYIFQNGPFPEGDNGLLTNSRNYVSYFTVLYSLPYFIHCYDYKKTPSIIVPLISLFISIFTIGRGGIIISFILLIGVLMMKMSQKGKGKHLYRLLVIGLVLIVAVIGLNEYIIESYFSRFVEVGMNDAGRSPAWIEYSLSLFNPFNLLLGTRVESLKYLRDFLGGSLHNSYFTLHAREGIVGLFLVVVMISGFIQLCKKHCFPIVIVIAALLFKGMSDADTGGTYSGGDIYVYFLFLVFYYYKKRRKRKYAREDTSVIPSTVPPDTGE